MAAFSFIVELKRTVHESTWPWLIPALRQLDSIWDSLQGEFGKKALLCLGDQAEAYSPAALCLLAMGYPDPITTLQAEIIDPVPEPDFSPNDQGQEQEPPPDLSEAGLWALGWLEQIRSSNSAQGILQEAVEASPVAVACLYGMVSDPLELLIDLLNIGKAKLQLRSDLMAAFAGYGFPKAHAASYAQVAWRSAWSKVHYPAVFMASVLANWGGYYGQRVYLTATRRMGLSVHPPHVNHARREFSLVYLEGKPALFMGLDQVRDLTRRTQERILTLRPFRSLMDFLRRVDPRPVEAQNLVRVGGLEGFETIPGMLKQLELGIPEMGQLSLFDLDSGVDDIDPHLNEWTLEEQVAAQEEVLGVGVAAHPLELVSDKIAQAGAITTLEATARAGEKVRVAGVKQTWRRVQSARGEPVYFMSLEDLEGKMKGHFSPAFMKRLLAVVP